MEQAVFGALILLRRPTVTFGMAQHSALLFSMSWRCIVAFGGDVCGGVICCRCWWWCGSLLGPEINKQL